MNIKLIATDMDGTLLDSQKRKPVDFDAWVLANPDKKMVIASGRQYNALKKDFMEISDHIIYIAENGGVVMEKEELIYTDPLSESDILAVLEAFGEMEGLYMLLCGVNGAYTKKVPAHVKKEAFRYYTALYEVDDLREAISKDTIVKIAMFIDGGRAEEVYNQISAPSERLEIVLSGASWLDCANKTENKGNAMKAIQKRYGISPDESMAFGDYLNDYTLLQACTESYCMENGHADLKAIAKHIADSNDNDGVMKVLRSL